MTQRAAPSAAWEMPVLGSFTVKDPRSFLRRAARLPRGVFRGVFRRIARHRTHRDGVRTAAGAAA